MRRRNITSDLVIEFFIELADGEDSADDSFYSVSPRLPSNLTLNARNGYLSGEVTMTSESANYTLSWFA